MKRFRKSHYGFNCGALARLHLCSWTLILVVFTVMATPPSLAAATSDAENLAPGRIMAQQAVKKKEMWITSDHAQHDILKKEFTAGPEVTQACLSCHNQAALQFHETIHWTWMDPITEKSAKLGKGGLSVNNF